MSATRTGVRTLSFRWHGRGGYGAKTAAMLLAEAVIDAGGFAQAAPEFGPERRGAPVQAFTRIAEDRIAERGPVLNPDVIVVLDPGLLDSPQTLAGATPDCAVFVNAPEGARAEIAQKVTGALVLADASAAARAALNRDLPNVPMLAAVVEVYQVLPRQEFLAWLERRLGRDFRPEIVAGNLAAATTVMTALAGRPLPTPLRNSDGKAVPLRLRPHGNGQRPPAPPRPESARGLRWQDAMTGPLMPARSSRQFLTGDWREQRPLLDLDKCIHCMLCWLFCPDSSIQTSGGRVTGIDLTYCKGCGICAEVCPPKAAAIAMAPEEA